MKVSIREFKGENMRTHLVKEEEETIKIVMTLLYELNDRGDSRI